jgi:hypothetical protein
MLSFVLIFLAEAIDFRNKLGKVTWPVTTWVISPLQSTSWHEGETVTLTFSFSSTVDMDPGIAEISFPDGFSENLVTYSLDKGVVALNDYSISFDDFELPASGIYGPIVIKLRLSETGTIVAINQFFTSIFIEGPKPVPEDGSLTAVFYDVTKQYVRDSSSIYFDFKISQNLWKFDVFYLYIDSKFSMQSPSCKSLKVIGEYNNLNSSSSTSLNTLPCVYESDLNRVKIYGLGVDIYIERLSETGYITGRLMVSGFTNPNADYDEESYNWQLYIGRYGVNAFIAAYQGSGPTTYTGKISVSSWKPSKSVYSASEIPLGMTLYMDLTFTTSHDIPKEGSIKFKFSGGVNIKEKSWRFTSSGIQSESLGDSEYYFFSPYVGGTCTFNTATELICKDFENDIIAGTLTLTTYTYFLSTSPSIMTITSYVDGIQGTIIDEVLANPASIVYASSEKMDVTDKFNLYFTDALDNSANDKYLANTGHDAKYMIIQFKISEDMDDDQVTIRVPMSTSSRLFNIKTVSSATGKYSTSDTEKTLTDLTFTSLSSVTISGDTITFSMSATKNYYISVYIELTSNNFEFPYTGSNLLTRYEAYIEIVTTAITFKYAKGLTFIPDSPTLTFEVTCLDSSIPGLPAKISFTSAFDFTLSSGFDSDVKSDYKLYLDITFTGELDDYFDSGLSDGEDYPFYSSEDGKLTVNETLLTWSGFTSVSSSSAFSVTFPFGKMTDLYFYTASILLYFIDPDRADVKYEILKSTSDDFQSLVSTGSWTTQTLSGTTTFKTSESISSLSFTLKEPSSSTSGTLGFLLPQGFTISSGKISDTSAEMQTYSFSSSNMYFKTPGMFTTLSGSYSISSDTDFTLTGITTSTFFNPSSSQLEVKPIYSSSNNALCKGIPSSTTTSVTLQAGTIATPTFSPTTGTGAGPGSLNLDVSVKFRNTHAIPKGGKIVLVFASDWIVTSTSELAMTVKGKTVDFSDVSLTEDSGVYSVKNLPAIDANSEIVISVSDCVQPKNNDVVDLKVAHFSLISTYATLDDTQKIDEWADSTTDSLTLKPSLASSNVTVDAVELFPNSTSSSAYFGVEFLSKNSLPIGTQIKISSPVGKWKFDEDISDYITFSLEFSKAEVSDENLIITLAEEYTARDIMILLVDHALELDKAGVTEQKIKISISYNGVEIDGYENDGIQVKVAPKFTTLDVNLTIDPVTALELSNYTFYFQSKVTSGSTIFFIFPIEYDYFLGRSSRTYVISSPEIYYIPCSSSIGTIECEVQHRAVAVKIPKDIEKGTITLIGIYNPNITNENTYVKVYSNSSAGNFSGNEIVKITGIEQPYNKNIQIRKVEKTDHFLQKYSSEYIFEFYMGVDTTFPLDSLIITFPDAYNLNRDMDLTIPCTLHTINTTHSLSLKTEVQSTKKCYNINKNQLKLVLLEEADWTEVNLAHLTLINVSNPEFAKTMKTPLDSKVYKIYDQWTSQFTISIRNGSNYIAKTYTNMNAAYMGFNNNSYTFSVNNYNPLNYEGTIVLIPGTQSKDIYITTDPAYKSKNALLDPLNINNKALLEFDSSKSFKIFTGQSSLPFRVSTAIDQEEGLNFITWNLTENTLDGSSDIYTAPVKTRVEVFTGKVKVNIGKITDIRVGSVSLPVSVSVDYSPHTELIVAIQTSEANLTVTPTTLLFTRGDNKLFYQIEISENFTSSTSNSITISYELSGTDASAYEIQPSTFKVSTEDDSVPIIKNVQVSNINRKSMKLTVITDVPSVICWQLTETSNELKNLTEIQSLTTSLVGSNSMPSFQEQANDYQNFIPSEPADGDTWESFQRDYYEDFLTRSFYGCTFNGLTSVEIFNVDWLWAETTYKVIVYAGSEESNYTVIQSTQAFAAAVNTTVFIKQSIDKSLILNVTNGLSKDIGLSVSQFYQYAFESTDTYAKVYYYIYPDRYSSQSIKDMASRSSYTYLKQNLKEKGIIGTITVTNVEIKREASDSNIINAIDIYDNSRNTITLSMECNNDGEVTCFAYKVMSYGNFPDKQLIGLDDLNQGVNNGNSLCEFNSSTNVQITGLSGNTEYNISCFGYDAYLIWPNYINVITSEASTREDESSTTVVSAAEYFGVALVFFFI